MAVQTNKSTEQVVSERKIYTGPILVNVVAVNPGLTRLTEMGLNFDSEPQYLTEDPEGNKLRIEFYVQRSEFLNKVIFYLEDKDRTSRNGEKYEIINDKGQSTYATTIEEAVERKNKSGNFWFGEEGARIAKVGEVDFYSFIKFWGNVRPEDNCVLDNFDNLFKGDYSELTGLVKTLMENEVWVMAVVNAKNFQNINNRVFGRATTKRFPVIFSKEAKRAADAGYPIRDHWSVEFKEFIPQPVEMDEDPPSKTTDLNTNTGQDKTGIPF